MISAGLIVLGIIAIIAFGPMRVFGWIARRIWELVLITILGGVILFVGLLIAMS